MKLQPGEKVITAFAEEAHGPGWANCPIWVVVQTEKLHYRLTAIQPEDQTSQMRLLYNVSAHCHLAMTSIVNSEIEVEDE
jgi:hypothetical protein